MSENEGNNQQQGEPNGPNPNNPQPEKQEVTFVISRHKAFFDMLKNPRTSFRITIMMAAFLIVLFLGLTLLTLTLKKKYPYSLIKSNEYGAFFMQSEDVEINNFMFNTAEIFANSGVEVKKGDKLSIQATGKFHTAVQHLADTNIDAIWLGPEGDENPVDPRDKRLQEIKVLLATDVTPECLLCFILNKEEEKCLEDYVKAQSDYLKDWKLKGVSADSSTRNECLNKLDTFVIMPHKTEKIGRGKEFNAWQDGKLFFVINDIIFTKRVDSIICHEGYFIGPIDTKDKNKNKNKDKPIKWSTTTTYNDDYKNRFKICPDAWYLDNVGSFLITIEKSQEK